MSERVKLVIRDRELSIDCNDLHGILSASDCDKSVDLFNALFYPGRDEELACIICARGDVPRDNCVSVDSIGTIGRRGWENPWDLYSCIS